MVLANKNTFQSYLPTMSMAFCKNAILPSFSWRGKKKKETYFTLSTWLSTGTALQSQTYTGADIKEQTVTAAVHKQWSVSHFSIIQVESGWFVTTCTANWLMMQVKMTQFRKNNFQSSNPESWHFSWQIRPNCTIV